MALRDKPIARLAALGLGGAMMLLAQQSAASGPGTRPVVNLQCTLSGSVKGASGLTRAAVCARFVQRIEGALKVRLVEAPSASGPEGRWIEIQIKLVGPAHAEAAFTSRLGGKVRKHQPIGVDVMDKGLDLREIDILADAVAQALRTAG
jgi:hypothetical protein